MLKWRMNCSLFSRSEAWRHLMDTVPCLTLSEMLMLQTLPTHSPLTWTQTEKNLNTVSAQTVQCTILSTVSVQVSTSDTHTCCKFRISKLIQYKTTQRYETITAQHILFIQSWPTTWNSSSRLVLWSVALISGSSLEWCSSKEGLASFSVESN